MQRRDEPMDIVWSNLQPNQKHSYSSFLHDGILPMQVTSQCIDGYDTVYQRVQTVEQGHWFGH